MKHKIKVGDKFYVPTGHKGYPHLLAIRMPDDPDPAFECETMRVKVFAVPEMERPEENFPVEPEWFYQRGLDFE